jgi:hypothetical protein
VQDGVILQHRLPTEALEEAARTRSQADTQRTRGRTQEQGLFTVICGCRGNTMSIPLATHFNAYIPVQEKNQEDKRKASKKRGHTFSLPRTSFQYTIIAYPEVMVMCNQTNTPITI